MSPSKNSTPPEQITQPSVEFVGEQDGPPERELKTCLSAVFASRPEVARAYLCRVRYAGTDAVALALASPEDPNVAADIGEVFGQMFGASCSLDIIFVDSDMEAHLARVCAPFFTA